MCCDVYPPALNAGNCADLEEQFASVPDTGLEDWRCPAFPDEARARGRTVHCVLFARRRCRRRVRAHCVLCVVHTV